MNNYDQEFDDLRELKDKFEDPDGSLDKFNGMLKLSMQGQAIKELPFFKALLREAKRKLDAINNQLQEDDMLDEQKRNKLFAEKNVWRWLIRKFDLVDSTPQVIKEEIRKMKKMVEES